LKVKFRAFCICIAVGVLHHFAFALDPAACHAKLSAEERSVVGREGMEANPVLEKMFEWLRVTEITKVKLI